jgi:hypothetical protein
MAKSIGDHAYKRYCEEELLIDTSCLAVAPLPFPFVRGLLATKAVKKGQKIVQVPLPALITEAAAREPDMLPFFELVAPAIAGIAGEEEDAVLALVLLFHRHVLKDKSRWAKHLAVLPDSYDLPWSWTDEERDALDGANLHPIAVAMLGQLRHDHRLLAPHIASAGAALSISTAKGFTEADYEWALSTVWSRGVSLRLSAKASAPVVKAISPFFDMFNHHPGAQMKHSYDIARGALVVTADQSYEPGEQVFLNYGPYTSLENVKLRGFVTPGNPYEWYQLQILLQVREDIDARLKIVRQAPPSADYRNPEEHGQVRLSMDNSTKPPSLKHVEGFFELHEGACNEALFRFVRVVLAEEGEELVALDSAVRRSLNAFEDMALEARVVQALSSALIEMLKNLKEAQGEAALLAGEAGDLALGGKGMAALTASIQKQLGYTPAPGRASSMAAAVASSSAAAEDEDGLGLLLSKPAKGKGGAAAAAPADAPVDAPAAPEPAPEPLPAAYSGAESDTHLRRMQLVAHMRLGERRILEWHLRQLEEHSQQLREIAEEHNSLNEAARALAAQD